jgi:hypothetical protein
MPAIQLGTRKASRFEVVGQYGPVAPTVVHVGLLASEGELRAGASVEVLDMGPPLRLSPPNPMTSPAVVGWLPLTRDEEEALDAWVSDARTRISESSYVACPAEEVVRDAKTERITSVRYSCAGFVASAYAQGAGVALLSTELPEMDFATVRRVWAHLIRDKLTDERALQFMIQQKWVPGPPPWRVLAPGYLLQALSRARDALPYTPRAEDLWAPLPFEPPALNAASSS